MILCTFNIYKYHENDVFSVNLLMNKNYKIYLFASIKNEKHTRIFFRIPISSKYFQRETLRNEDFV